MARWTGADVASPLRTLYAIDSEHPQICAANCGTPPWSRLCLRAAFLYRLVMPFCSSFCPDTPRAFGLVQRDAKGADAGTWLIAGHTRDHSLANVTKEFVSELQIDSKPKSLIGQDLRAAQHDEFGVKGLIASAL